MRDVMLGEGWTNHPWVIPTISHPNDPLDHEIYGPRVIYVGKPIEWLQCTPWVNPCDIAHIRDPQAGRLTFERYCELRADKEEFLAPLVGCHLVCDCKYDVHTCHASLTGIMCRVIC